MNSRVCPPDAKLVIEQTGVPDGSPARRLHNVGDQHALRGSALERPGRIKMVLADKRPERLCVKPGKALLQTSGILTVLNQRIEAFDAALCEALFSQILADPDQGILNLFSKCRISGSLFGDDPENCVKRAIHHPTTRQIRPARSRNSAASVLIVVVVGPYLWSSDRRTSDHSAARAISSACGMRVWNRLNCSLSSSASLI